jgi:NAD(P)-dependent dehydrogenase (short-subunit alcohol dehydrogenase family)
VTKAVTAHFNIATAVGRHMARRGHGVILVMAGGREAIPRLGGPMSPGPGSPESAASSPPSSDRTACASRAALTRLTRLRRARSAAPRDEPRRE